MTEAAKEENKNRGLMKMRVGHQLGGITKRVKDVAGGGGLTPGYYDSLRLDDAAIWLRIHPEQLYEQTVYERDAKAIVEVMYPWYQTEQHWVSSMNGGRGGVVPCSSGPEKAEDCLGCDVDSLFWDWRRDFISAKGFKPEQGSPAGRTTRYTTSVVVAENFYRVPVLTNEGRPRMSKKGKPIFNDVPGPQLARGKRTGDSTFGKKLHWGFGVANRTQLFDMNKQLMGSCGSCASDLVAVGIKCPECATTLQFEDPEVGWQELAEIREETNQCEDCGYSGHFLVDYECSNDECKDPKEGSILSFELQLRLRKGANNARDLILEDFRMPTEGERMEELLKEPMDIVKIKTPHEMNENAKNRLQELVTIWKDKVSGVEQGVPYGEAGSKDVFDKDDED